MSCLVWYPADDAFMDTQQVKAGEVYYTIEAGVPIDIPQQHLATVTAALQARQGNMTSGSAPTVTPQGTAQTTAYSYEVVPIGQTGDAQPSAAGSTSTGNATLNGTNFNRITWTAVPHATGGYKILRTASAGTPSSTGLIGQVAAGVLAFNDTGLAASAYTPAGSQPPVDLVKSCSADL